jgi:hypothetical protein
MKLALLDLTMQEREIYGVARLIHSMPTVIELWTAFSLFTWLKRKDFPNGCALAQDYIFVFAFPNVLKLCSSSKQMWYIQILLNYVTLFHVYLSNSALFYLYVSMVA